MALKLIECTHCGCKFKTDIKKLLEDGEATAVRSLSDFWKPRISEVKTIDIKCINCQKTFEYPTEL